MTDSAESDDIRRQLQQPLSLLTPRQQVAFNAYQLRHYRGFYLTINLLAQAAYFLYGLADLLIVPDVGSLSMAIRATMLLVTCPLAVWLIYHLRSSVLIDLIAPCLILVATVLWFWLLSLSNAPGIAEYQYASVIFIALANLSVQVRFLPGLVVSLLIAAVTLTGVFLVNEADWDIFLVFLLVYVPVVAFSIFTSWSTTLDRRRAFLRATLEDVRTQQLQRLLDHEKAVREQYQRFGALVSHEFRNALGIIESQISVLRQESENGRPQIEKRTLAMRSATRRISKMFDDWIRSDRLYQSLRRADLGELELVGFVSRFLGSHVHLTQDHVIEWDETFYEDQQILADALLLEMALANLVENACKYSAPGRRVRIELRTTQRRVGIVVTDQGIGIAPEHRAQIFGEYFRVEPEGAVRGLGLGLSIVQRIADLHGGAVEVRSAPQEGSAFCLWLDRSASANRSIADDAAWPPERTPGPPAEAAATLPAPWGEPRTATPG